MRRIEKDISTIAFTKIADELFNESGPLIISILGWQDGDYFKELCEEDGGMHAEHLKFFQNMPLGQRVEFRRLKEIIDFMETTPYLRSIGGNYKFNYDLHVWSDNSYVVFNSAKKRYCISTLNTLDKFLKKAILPSWQILNDD